MLKTWFGSILKGAVSGIIGSFVVFVLLNIGLFKPFFYRFEAATYDWRMRKIITPPPNPIGSLIIVSVDGRSLNKLGAFYQWPRTLWGQAIDILNEGGARLVGVDVLFDKSQRFPQEDSLLVEAVSRHGNVFNAMVLTDSDPDNFLPPMAAEPGGLIAERFYQQIPDLTYRIPAFDRMEPDFPELMNAGAGIGAVNLSSDSDGVLRRIPLLLRFNQHVYPTLAFSMALKELQASAIHFDAKKRVLQVDTRSGNSVRIPVDKHGRMLIYYHGPYQTFRYVSIYSLIHEIYPTQAQTNALALFRDKIVMLGADAPGLFDLRAIPRQPAFPGVEVHANVLWQILQGNFIREFTGAELFWMVLLTGLVSGILFALFRPFAGILTAILLGVIGFTAAWVSFEQHALWVPMIAPLITVLLTFTIHYTYRYTLEERNKREIRGIFSRYVSAKVVDEMLKNPGQVELGGEKKVCTVLFSDLANFTSLAEVTPPEQLVKLLNEYLTGMTHIVLENQGTLDKYEADALMAIFGAPTDIGNHAVHACRTALSMQQAMEDIRQQWKKRKLPQLSQRIGINTGQMVIGNMGSDIRFDYTAIGDAVNLGSRLEGANKLYGTGILISDDTYQMARDHILARQLDLLRVKGKQEPVKVYELMAMRDDKVDIKTREVLNYFQQGYQHYLAQNWEWAMNQFRQALQINRDDEPSRLYLLRCQEFLHRPPGKDWDGVYTLKTK